MMYLFIGKEWGRGIPPKETKEFAAICKSDHELYQQVLENPKGFEVYLIDRQMDEENVLQAAKEYDSKLISDKERAEYERLKQKFEK